jgi:hypothetical protein
MKRREALAALMALPAATRITRAEVQTGDVIVFECPGYISDEAVARIRKCAETVWPDNRIAVLGDGMRLKIVAGT